MPLSDLMQRTSTYSMAIVLSKFTILDSTSRTTLRALWLN
jgi:hypothetical protein